MKQKVKMKKILLYGLSAVSLFCVLVFLYCILPSWPSKGEDIIEVSMSKLIAMPESYDGKKVRLRGFAVFSKDSEIFASEQDLIDGKVINNNVWLDAYSSFRYGIRAKLLHKKYVVVEGIFYATKKGGYPISVGTIKHISRLDRWKE